MQSLTIRLRPLSAFGGPIKGDTLFGQLCWAARNRWGEDRLEQLLQGYTDGRPWAVCSDAFPAGYLPRPALPLYRYEPLEDSDRKAVKRRRWLPRSALDRPLRAWLGYCRGEGEITRDLTGTAGGRLSESHAQPHNSIDRRSNTTGGADFAPYTLSQEWFAAGLQLDVYLLIDPERVQREEAIRLLTDIGLAGFGRDAGIGLGKFALEQVENSPLPAQADGDTCYTLAPCAPQGLGMDPNRSYYGVFTRFGRHGDRAVHSGRPFKAPILMAEAGALLTPETMPDVPFIGQGLGGEGRLSKVIPGTVQQGYAPYIAIRMGGHTA